MAKPAARSPELEQYFKFAAWLASKPELRPVTKAVLLFQIVEFFGLKPCASLGHLDEVREDNPGRFSEGLQRPSGITTNWDKFLVVAHDRRRCFVVDEKGHVHYCAFDPISGQPTSTNKIWT